MASTAGMQALSWNHTGATPPCGWTEDTCSLRTCDSLSWLPTEVTVPLGSSNDLILAGIQDMLAALRNPPTPGSPLNPLTLKLLSELITGLVPVPKPLLAPKLPPLRVAKSETPPPLRGTPLLVLRLAPDPDPNDDAQHAEPAEAPQQFVPQDAPHIVPGDPPAPSLVPAPAPTPALVTVDPVPTPAPAILDPVPPPAPSLSKIALDPRKVVASANRPVTNQRNPNLIKTTALLVATTNTQPLLLTSKPSLLTGHSMARTSIPMLNKLPNAKNHPSAVTYKLVASKALFFITNLRKVPKGRKVACLKMLPSPSYPKSKILIIQAGLLWW